MEVDIKRLTDTLNQTAETIREASKVAQSNPARAMSFIPTVMKQIRDLQSFGNLDDISASIKNDSDKNSIQTAIGSFLQNSREAQEQAGSMGAAFFNNPQFQMLKDNLEQVKASLETGKRVQRPEKGQGI